MKRWSTGILALALGGALAAAVASAASAGVPSSFSTFDPVGVGTNTGTAIGGSPPGFDVWVKDIENQPIPGAIVTLVFAGTGVRAYAVQNAGTTVDAITHSLSRVASTGPTNFAARTGGFTNTNAVQVVADGVLLGSVKWRSTDIDAADGMTSLIDLSYFTDRYLRAIAAPECNFDLSSGDVPVLGDLALLANEYLSTGESRVYAW